MEHGVPADDQIESIEASRRWGLIYQDWFLGGIFWGTYPQEVVDAFGIDMPNDFDRDMATISQPIDWLGINYYTQTQWLPHGKDFFDLTSKPWPIHTSPPLTSLGWKQHPDGLSFFLERTAEKYTKALPLYVTENGMAWDGLEDLERLRYFDTHLRACAKSIANGVPLRGYFAWSLIDNYEWAHGYDQRFGLIHVDYRTQRRTPKASARAWQAFLGSEPIVRS